MKKAAVANALIFDELQEHVLLVHNNNNHSPYWSLPGGYVEPGESLTEAVIREVKEETGLTVTVSYLYWVRRKPAPHDRFASYHFQISKQY